MSRVLDYCRRGWYPIRVPRGQKRPTLPGWQKLRITADTVNEYFNGEPTNFGILLGDPSGGLVDIDLDCPEALELADRFLPSTESVFGRAGKPCSHRLYTAPGARSVQFSDPRGGMLVELRSTGMQTIFPGSVHTSGEPIEWEMDGQPAEVEAAELTAAAGMLAAACLVRRHVW